MAGSWEQVSLSRVKFSVIEARVLLLVFVYRCLNSAWLVCRLRRTYCNLLLTNLSLHAEGFLVNHHPARCSGIAGTI